MIEVDSQGEVARAEQLKRFPFFNNETIKEKVPEAMNHPLTFSELSIKDIKAIYPKYMKGYLDYMCWNLYQKRARFTYSLIKLLEAGNLILIIHL